MIIFKLKYCNKKTFDAINIVIIIIINKKTQMNAMISQLKSSFLNDINNFGSFKIKIIINLERNIIYIFFVKTSIFAYVIK